MGWWSANVMGGDTPADFEGAMLDIVGIGGSFFDRFCGSDFSEEVVAQIKEKFNAKTIAKIERWIDKEDQMYFGHGDDRNIAYQVLGVLIMRYGAPMSADLKKRIIQGAKDDEWAQEDGERKAIMKSFIEDVKKYDGKTPTELTDMDEGLFGAIGKALASNKEGLINK